MGETILFCFVFLSQVLLISWLYPRRVISRGDTCCRISRRPRIRSSIRTPRVLRALAPQDRAGQPRDRRRGPLDHRRADPPDARRRMGRQDRHAFAERRMDAAIVIPFFLVQFLRERVHQFLEPQVSTGDGESASAPRAHDGAAPSATRRFRLADHARRRGAYECRFHRLHSVLLAFRITLVQGRRQYRLRRALLLAFSVTVAIALRAPKTDPYQAHQDRSNTIKFVVKQALAFCIAYPVLLTISDHQDLRSGSARAGPRERVLPGPCTGPAVAPLQLSRGQGRLRCLQAGRPRLHASVR